MDYKHSHLIQWFKDHDLISLSGLERQSNMPKGTLRHFLKERTRLPAKHYDKLIKVIGKYGFRELDVE